MDKNFSFTAIEKKLAPEFRKKVNAAETPTDLKNLFSQTGLALLQKALSPETRIFPKDIVFAPEKKELYLLDNSMSSQPKIRQLLDHSDLRQVMNRFAKSVNRRFLHLKKHMQKTNLKIRK